MEATIQSLGIDRLPIADRIRLFNQIWESIEAETQADDLPEWHKSELDRRLAEEDADDPGGLLWSEVRARIERRLSHPKS